jgi:hypothetical protein
MGDFPIKIDAPAKVSLFAYDNHTFVVESFLDTDSKVSVLVDGGSVKLRNLATGEVLTGEPGSYAPGRRGASPTGTRFDITLNPHSYLAFSEG